MIYFKNLLLVDEQTTKNHPLSCYTSRRINFSARLNEDLSSKIIAEKEYNSVATLSVLSESLGKYFVFTIICMSYLYSKLFIFIFILEGCRIDSN